MSMDYDGLCWTVMHSHSGFRPWYRMPSAWSISASVMTSGGAKRIMFPCVGFASSPRLASFKHIFPAKPSAERSFITTALSRPFPLTSSMMGESKARTSLRNRSPCTCAFCAKSSSTSTFRASVATRQAKGLPPNVLPCCPGLIVSMTSWLASTADTGIVPPDSALPRTRMSGLTLLWSQASIRPVRHSPVCTSSAMRSTLYLVHRSRTPAR
mmetsp:Transcript_15549/g.34342  ORF Transcript_15549/g.34342 Transcript_15549/m.34342 type:complete len:212 (-) Transcript_15549:740-1375(-)